MVSMNFLHHAKIDQTLIDFPFDNITRIGGKRKMSHQPCIEVPTDLIPHVYGRIYKDNQSYLGNW